MLTTFKLENNYLVNLPLNWVFLRFCVMGFLDFQTPTNFLIAVRCFGRIPAETYVIVSPRDWRYRHFRSLAATIGILLAFAHSAKNKMASMFP